MRRARRLTRFSVVVAIYLAVANTFPVTAAGQSTEPFAGFAQGDGVLIAASNPSLPLGVVIQGVGPDATVRSDSFGTAESSASFPYLGPGVQGLPGLLAGAFNVPIPSYPLQATVSAGQAPARVSAPGIDLMAEAPDGGPRAEATVGTTALGATSNATVTVDDGGTITARADATVNVVNLAGLLTLRGVESHAQVVADPSTGEIRRTSSLSIGALAAPGLTITVPETTPAQIPIPVPIPGLPQIPPVVLPPIPLPFAGETIAGPRIGYENGSFTLSIPGIGDHMFPIPAEPVIAAFKALGIDMSIEQAQELSTGVIAPVLTLRFGVELPENPSLQGVTTLDVSLGKTSATVDLHPAGASEESGSELPSDPGLPVLGDSGLVTTPDLGSPAAPVAVPQGPGVITGQRVPIGLQHEAGVFYMILVVVAAGAFATGQFLRLKGVRTAWDS